MSYKDEMDEFWDLSKLVPRKKSVGAFSAREKTHEYTAPGSDEPEDKAERRLTFKELSMAEDRAPDTSYTPRGEGLIKRVTIKRTHDRFDFYGNFRKAAMVYFDFKASRCDFVQFYSYMPQYSQLSTAQKNYYFYWRDELRQGRLIKSDYSYLCLFAYEILNLPDLIPPKEGIELLCKVWRGYRRELPRLDESFAVWVQDYCLVHALPCPTEYIGDFVHEIIEQSGLREFYLSGILGLSPESMAVTVSYLSDYDWRRAKYAVSDNDGVYSKHMLGAMGRLLLHLWSTGELIGKDGKTVTLSKSAFPRSLCTHSVKCTLEIEYCPISESLPLREAVTSAVRYTENKLRALIGVKSRLAVKNIDPYHKNIIDTYFDSIYRKESEKRRLESVPEYEKLYDAPNRGVDISGADEIERSSWENTRRLVVEEELLADEIIPVASTQTVTEEPTPTEEQTETEGLAPTERELLSRLLCGFVCASAEYDLAAERINELALDSLGDILIDIGDSGYGLIEDYREEAERLLEE